jgi:hypothetical protein
MHIFFIITLLLSIGIVAIVVKDDTFEKNNTSMTRTFLLLLAIGSILCAWYLIQSFDSLKNTQYSINERVAQYTHYTKGLMRGTYIIAFLLLALANILYMRKVAFNKWAFIMTALFFAVFVSLDTMYLAEAYFHFKKNNGLWRGEFSISGFGGLIYSLMASALIGFNYWFLKSITGRRK